MKVITFTKKSLLSLFVCVLVCACIANVVISTTVKAVQTVSSEKDIPIYCVDREDKVVSISFDAAWGNEQTNTLLDILDEYKVKSTFFLVGEWVDKYPDSVKEIAKRGHDVGNHSDTHAHMTQQSTDEQMKEISSCNEKIKALTGTSPTLFRPPYGDYDNSVVASVKNSNMYCVQWDVDSLDWKDPTPQQMVERITSKLTSGSIILMHNGAKNTPEALPMIIDAVRAEGYEFVPISEIILEGDYTTDHEGRMHTTEQ